MVDDTCPENTFNEEKELSLAGNCWEQEYESDLSSQRQCGPHDITDKDRDLNNQVKALLMKDRNVDGERTSICLFPIPDIHKISDCDLIYRHLIGKKWNVAEAAESLKFYRSYRIKHRLDEILWEKSPPEMSQLAIEYKGFDKEGNPILFDSPDPKVIRALIESVPRDQMLRHHFRTIEEGRRLQKTYGAQRVSCIIDFKNISIGVVTKPSVMGYIKECTAINQALFPENMRFMLLSNGGWTFNSVYRLCRPFIQGRTQEKIGVVPNGAEFAPTFHKYVRPDQLPRNGGYNGSHDGTPLMDYAPLLSGRIAKGTPPEVQKATTVSESRV